LQGFAFSVRSVASAFVSVISIVDASPGDSCHSGQRPRDAGSFLKARC
jgi:hypothetical protein